MGYDVFNTSKVLPEYTTDIGTKKEEKVDYTILKNETPVIVIECKYWKENLNSHNSNFIDILIFPKPVLASLQMVLSITSLLI